VGLSFPDTQAENKRHATPKPVQSLTLICRIFGAIRSRLNGIPFLPHCISNIESSKSTKKIEIADATTSNLPLPLPNAPRAIEAMTLPIATNPKIFQSPRGGVMPCGLPPL
jgi:hypothetical protein